MLSPMPLITPIRCALSSPTTLAPPRTSRPIRAEPPINWQLYKECHQVECLFNKLKRFRRIALRCEKTITDFMGFVHLACAMIWLRYMQTGPRPDRHSGFPNPLQGDS